MYVAVAL